MNKKNIASLSKVLCAGLLSVGLASTANATLETRLGGLAYFDTVLGITWAADANINGRDTWANQQAWVSSFTIGGIGGWRLPSADVNGDDTIVDCFLGGGVAGCSDNEMGSLFLEESITPGTPGVFTNVEVQYWSGTEWALFPATNAWQINPGGGIEANNKDDLWFAWAVHDGDVGTSVVPTPAVPEPGTIALMGLGLAGLLGFRRRRKCAA